MNEFTANTFDGVPSRFDYNRLTQDNTLHVKRKTKEIRLLLQNKGSRVYGSDVFPIGFILVDVRKRMSQPLFDKWLEAEAQISKDAAGRIMSIFRKFGHKSSKLQNLTISALYLLTLPSYPQPFLEKVLSGEYVPSASEVQRMRILPKTEKSVAPPEIELQNTEDDVTTVKELEIALEIANEALAEKDNELQKLREDKRNLDSIVTYVRRICEEDFHVEDANKTLATLK